MIAVHRQGIDRALMHTFTELFGDTMLAARAVLRGVCWRHLDCYSTGTCCLVRGNPYKLAPGYVRNGLRQAMILHHVGNLQGFKGQHAVGVDHPASRLVTEIVAPVGNPFMDMGNHLTAFRSGWSSSPWSSFPSPRMRRSARSPRASRTGASRSCSSRRP